MTRRDVLLSAVAVLIVSVGLGYAWGGSGRRAAETALREARQQLDLAEARRAVLDARVSLYNNNFGDAARRFEEAKAPLRQVRARYQRDGRNEAAGSIHAALVHVEEAQRLAGQLDLSSNARAGEALEAIRVAAQE